MKKKFLATLSLMGCLLVGRSTLVGCNSEVKPEPITETYTISKGNIGVGGTVIFDKESAKKGEVVTISVATNTNYKIDEIVFKDSNGTIELTTVSENSKYTFVVGSSDVIVDCSFVSNGIKYEGFKNYGGKNYILTGMEEKEYQVGEVVSITISSNNTSDHLADNYLFVNSKMVEMTIDSENYESGSAPITIPEDNFVIILQKKSFYEWKKRWSQGFYWK